MAFPHLFSRDKTIAIDIGSALIKLMQIERAGDGWRVSRAVVHPTPPGACHDGMIADIPAVASAIKDALRGADMHATGALAAVSGSQVLVRHVQLPKMSEAVLRKSIRFEAAKYISASVDDSIVEFEIVEQHHAEGQMQVMLVATPRELIESRVAVIEEVGLEALVVDVEAFALIRSLVEFSRDPSILQDTIALVDMGAGHTDLNIVSEGQFQLTRNIPIAGTSLTQAIKSLINCDDTEAEALKRAVHIGPRLTTAGEPPDENLVKAARAIQPLLDELLREIRRSLHYFQSQFSENSAQKVVSRLLLTGGTSRMSGLPEYISAKLGVRAKLLNVISDGTIERGSLTDEDATGDGPLFGVVAGLVLKEESPAVTSVASKAAVPKSEAPVETPQVLAVGPVSQVQIASGSQPEPAASQIPAAAPAIAVPSGPVAFEVMPPSPPVEPVTATSQSAADPSESIAGVDPAVDEQESAGLAVVPAPVKRTRARKPPVEEDKAA